MARLSLAERIISQNVFVSHARGNPHQALRLYLKTGNDIATRERTALKHVCGRWGFLHLQALQALGANRKHWRLQVLQPWVEGSAARPVHNRSHAQDNQYNCDE